MNTLNAGVYTKTTTAGTEVTDGNVHMTGLYSIISDNATSQAINSATSGTN
jgi:hypothetical protein